MWRHESCFTQEDGSDLWVLFGCRFDNFSDIVDEKVRSYPDNVDELFWVKNEVEVKPGYYDEEFDMDYVTEFVCAKDGFYSRWRTEQDEKVPDNELRLFAIVLPVITPRLLLTFRLSPMVKSLLPPLVRERRGLFVPKQDLLEACHYPFRLLIDQEKVVWVVRDAETLGRQALVLGVETYPEILASPNLAYTRKEFLGFNVCYSLDAEPNTLSLCEDNGDLLALLRWSTT